MWTYIQTLGIHINTKLIYTDHIMVSKKKKKKKKQQPQQQQ